MTQLYPFVAHSSSNTKSLPRQVIISYYHAAAFDRVLKELAVLPWLGETLAFSTC